MKKRTKRVVSIAFFLALLISFITPSIQVQANDSATEYVVQSGDCLYKIAKAQLGSGNRWSEIFELNKDVIQDPGLIFVGQNLKLPGATSETTVVTTDASNEVVATEQSDSDEQKEADKYAQMLYDAAKNTEPAVTAVLKSMESDKAHLEGLDFCLKSVESTSRKILLNAHEAEISIEEASKTIKDSLRYTYIIDDSDYVEMSRKITDTLIANGNTVLNFKNFWINTTNLYQGINIQLQDKNGVIFELQLHTPTSYDTKEHKAHAYYEIVRSETATEEEKAEANKKMEEIFSLVPVPNGVETLTY
jgi:LysM repeat protein